jgi:hypothetical protein
MLGAHLEVAMHLLHEELAVGPDLDLVGSRVLGALEREEERAVLRHVVRGVPERLPVLEHRAVALGLDIDPGTGGARVAAGGAVDEGAEFHGAGGGRG